MKIFSLFIVTLLIISSCSKERKLAKKLEGSWNVISHRNNGNLQEIEMDGSTFIFDYCPPKEIECDGGWSGDLRNGGTFDFPYKFSINDEDDVSMQFNKADVDTIIEDFINTQLFFVNDTLELEFISNSSFFEFTMVQD